MVLVLEAPALERFTTSAASNTDTGLDHHITAPEDTNPVVARGIEDPSVLGLNCLRLLIDGLALGVRERPVRGLCRKLSHPEEDVLERRGRTIGNVQETDAVIDVAGRLSMDACGGVERGRDG